MNMMGKKSLENDDMIILKLKNKLIKKINIGNIGNCEIKYFNERKPIMKRNMVLMIGNPTY